MRLTFLQKDTDCFSDIIYMGIQAEENLFSFEYFKFLEFRKCNQTYYFSLRKHSCIQILGKQCPEIEMLEKIQQEWPVLNPCELKELAHWICVLHWSCNPNYNLDLELQFLGYMS